MPEDVDYAFHAARLLENPAWKKLFAELRLQLGRERDALDYSDEARRYVSIAETLLGKLERRAESMAQANKVEQYHKWRASKMA